MDSSDPFLDFGRDTGSRSALGTEPALALGSAVAAYGTAPTREDTEDALHSRLNAAIIDQILVGIFIGILALALHVTFASAAFAAVALGIELVYFFVQETRTGQTIGKRQYGVRVVNVDGTRPGP